eukprot:5913690-Alexandrium_andersonii.AAC.1
MQNEAFRHKKRPFGRMAYFGSGWPRSAPKCIALRQKATPGPGISRPFAAIKMRNRAVRSSSEQFGAVRSSSEQ